jgi:hypothetical protein
LEVDLDGNAAELPSLDPDERRLPVVEPFDVVRRADVDVRVVEWLVQLRVDMPPGSAALLEGSGESWPEATQQNAWNFVELVRPSALRVEED